MAPHSQLRLDSLPSRSASLHPSSHPSRSRSPCHSPLPSPALPVQHTTFYTLPPPSPSPFLPAPSLPIRKASLANLRNLRDSLLSKRSSGKSAKSAAAAAGAGGSARGSTASSSAASVERCDSPSSTSSARRSREGHWTDSYSSQATSLTSEGGYAYPDSPTCSYSAYLDADSQPSPSEPQQLEPVYEQISPLEEKAQEVQVEWSKDRCFCGAVAEEDSIYCGTACGRADAMRALCSSSTSTTPEPLSQPLAPSCSTSSTTSVSSTSTAGAAHEVTHYRRIEYEQAQQERERQRARKVERGARRAARAAAAASGSSAEASWREQVEGDRKRGTRSTTASEVPSLSCSSTTSSALNSPLSPTFPPSIQAAQAHAVAFNHYAVPPSPAFSNYSTGQLDTSLEEDGEQEEEEIFGAYQTTPKQTPRNRKTTRTVERTPEARIIADGFDDDEPSLLDYARGLSLHDNGSLKGEEQQPGMGYMQCMQEEEERDRVRPLAPSKTAQGGQRTGAQKHTRGKLSFDDVLSVMGA